MNIETPAIVYGLLFTCVEAIEGAVNHTPLERRGRLRRLLSGVSWMIPVVVIVYSAIHLSTL